MYQYDKLLKIYLMIYYFDGCVRKKQGGVIGCVSEKNELSL